MAVELKFTSTKRSEIETELILHFNDYNEIYIEIKDPECAHDWDYQYICLDKETAIKLAKELRKQILFLEG